MHDPHAILGLAAEASETEIRARYLELVRQFPPDRAPERFAEIRAAYDELRDPLARAERALFSLHTDESLIDLIASLRTRLRTARMPVETLLSLAEST